MCTFSTGLIAAILLVGPCAVKVCVINEPPTIQTTFHSATDTTMKVQFIGLGAARFDVQNIAAGAPEAIRSPPTRTSSPF